MEISTKVSTCLLANFLSSHALEDSDGGDREVAIDDLDIVVEDLSFRGTNCSTSFAYLKQNRGKKVSIDIFLLLLGVKTVSNSIGLGDACDGDASLELMLCKTLGSTETLLEQETDTIRRANNAVER